MCVVPMIESVCCLTGNIDNDENGGCGRGNLPLSKEKCSEPEACLHLPLSSVGIHVPKAPVALKSKAFLFLGFEDGRL